MRGFSIKVEWHLRVRPDNVALDSASAECYSRITWLIIHNLSRKLMFSKTPFFHSVLPNTDENFSGLISLFRTSSVLGFSIYQFVLHFPKILVCLRKETCLKQYSCIRFLKNLTVKSVAIFKLPLVIQVTHVYKVQQKHYQKQNTTSWSPWRRSQAGWLPCGR